MAIHPDSPPYQNYRAFPYSRPRLRQQYDVFPSQLTSPTLQHIPPFDTRASFDLSKSTAFSYGNQNPQLTSQTPFGPHLPANPPTGNVPPPPPPQQEDISTIFVVGFPDDMQEREFQNMFTFSSGFEAATLKIPNKEYTAYGTAPPGPARNYAYSGSNDPYNLVTMNQGGVVVDGRDGTMASWPAVDDSAAPGPHYSNSVPPRKQIIGFAKFRTKDEALAAKEMLQGKRVDIEKGAVLKAEMAKKNLHTKRGVGPVPGAAPNTIPAISNGLSVIPPSIINGPSDPYLLNEPSRDVGPVGLGRVQWREESAIEEQRWRERERELNVLGAMGLGTRGPRERAERAEEEERDRRRRLRNTTNSSSFDPFHHPPQAISRQTSGAPLLPLEVNGFHNHTDERVVPQPWDGNRAICPPSSRRSPTPPENPRPFSPSQPQPHSQSDSRASSVAGGSQHGGSTGHGSGSEEEISQTMGNLALSTNQGNTSPQLPSPSSGASSGGSTRNGVDQNPPINTLYVGNLPTSPPPPGMPPDVLEVSLRDLFSSRPGFRRLSFKQKSSGPMCFVEFEDVQYATKTLNDLYGHTLNGLVKGGGIRLSYSKNPLGVRTPTSATANSSSLQQQQNNGHFGLQDDRSFVRRGVLQPPSSSQYPPPPRFSASSSSGSAFDAPLPSAPSEFFPRGTYGYSLTPTSSFSPFGLSNPSHSTIPDQNETSDQQRNDQHYHFIPRALSPPTHNIEAARAG